MKFLEVNSLDNPQISQVSGEPKTLFFQGRQYTLFEKKHSIIWQIVRGIIAILATVLGCFGPFLNQSYRARVLCLWKEGYSGKEPVWVYLNNNENPLRPQQNSDIQFPILQSLIHGSQSLIKTVHSLTTDTFPFQEIKPPIIPFISLDDRKKAATEILKILKEKLAELDPNAKLPMNEDILYAYLAKLEVDFSGKKMVIFSKDLGGFGDFTFGIKTLSILQKRFPGLNCALATDNPNKALKVNNDHHVMMPPKGHQDNLPLSLVARYIEHFKPDFLVAAPVTHFDRHPFAGILSNVPHVFIREYGFTGKQSPLEKGDFIGGAGNDWKGVIVHQELLAWAEAVEAKNPLNRLAQLQNVHPEIQMAILGDGYSEHAINNFNQSQELFMGYGRTDSRVMFVLSIAKMLQQLQTQKNPCFVLFGSDYENMRETMAEQKNELIEFGVGQIEWINTNKFPHEKTIEKLMDNNNSKKIKIVMTQLLPQDVIPLMKATEKEILTTGDQSWIESISANKHWMQEFLIHKEDSVKGVISLIKELPNYDPRNPEFFNLINRANSKIKGSSVFKVSRERWEAQAHLFYQARTNHRVAQDWDRLNSRVTSEYPIEEWLIGIIIKKYLERNNSELNSHIQAFLQKPEVKPGDLLSFLEHTQDLLLT